MSMHPLLENVAEFLYPNHCLVCKRIVISKEEHAHVCDRCRKEIVYVKEPYCLRCGKPIRTEKEYCYDCERRKRYYIQGRSVFAYQGGVRTSLLELKYENKREYIPFFADAFCDSLGSWVHKNKIDVIVPIPLHPKKKRRRGYNQATLLAEAVGERLQIPVDESLLSRRIYTRPLKELAREERFRAMRHVFEAGRKIEANQGVLLLDDIYTTGTTMDSAAIALLVAGSRRIYAGTMAIGG